MSELTLTLHPRQREAFESRANEIMFGGAKGGGKSHLMRIAAILWCFETPGLQVYLFRRHLPDLQRNHMDGPKGFKALLDPWVKKRFVEIVEDEIRFVHNGAKIHLCHCNDDEDRWKYHGAEIHVLLMDELQTFSETIYRFLRGNVRAVGLKPPEKYKNTFPRILCSANPGGRAHHFVKKTWVDPQEPGVIWETPETEGGMNRQYIPALLEDNPSMLADDPSYEARLKGMGSRQLVQAMRYGDWSVIEGQFLPEFDPLKQVIPPFDVPTHWTRVRSFDWGYSAPFYVGWYSIADQEMETTDSQGEVIKIPAGSIIQYREWNGEAEYNEGLKMQTSEIAEGIRTRETQEYISYSVADSAIWDTSRGPSIAEQMSSYGARFEVKSEKNRKHGWQEIRNRLQGVEGRPLLYFFRNCLGIIRDLPSLQFSERDAEDCDTDCADHSCDALRYFCMSRPYVTHAPKQPKMITANTISLNDLWREHEREIKKNKCPAW